MNLKSYLVTLTIATLLALVCGLLIKRMLPGFFDHPFRYGLSVWIIVPLCVLVGRLLTNRIEPLISQKKKRER